MRTTEQKVENAITWIDGLAKTRVKQTHGRLGDSEDGYCCLGYGCMKLKVDCDSFDEFSGLMAYRVGLKTVEGMFDGDYIEEKESLADLNDSGGYSFNAISKIIKENTMKLFEREVAQKLDKHYT